jgi:hypothetical protein
VSTATLKTQISVRLIKHNIGGVLEAFPESTQLQDHEEVDRDQAPPNGNSRRQECQGEHAFLYYELDLTSSSLVPCDWNFSNDSK